MTTTCPTTPSTNRTGKGLDVIVEHLNLNFDLKIPNPTLSSPGSRERGDRTLDWKCLSLLKRLHYNRKVDINRVIQSYDEEVRSKTTQWVYKEKQDVETLPRSSDFLRRSSHQEITEQERTNRLKMLLRLLDDEHYLVNNGTFSPHAVDIDRQPKDLSNGAARPATTPDPCGNPKANSPTIAKRKSFGEAEVFHTAPNSPTILPEISKQPTDAAENKDEFEDPEWDSSLLEMLTSTDDSVDLSQRPSPSPSPKKSKNRQSRISDFMKVAKRTDTLSPNEPLQGDRVKMLAPKPAETISFASTTTTSSIFDSSKLDTPNTSFNSVITKPMDEPLIQTSSTDAAMLAGGMARILNGEAPGKEGETSDLENDLIRELLEHGPFRKRTSFPPSVDLRYRYELERLAQEWRLPPKQILAGNQISHESHSTFWEWVERHSKRNGKGLPEKSSKAAWDSAVGDFRSKTNSTAVVALTGFLECCPSSENGLFKLKLNPLRTELGCRFHRRFGPDRFLSFTMPAQLELSKSKPRAPDATIFGEVITRWLTQHDHYLLGRTWRAFYVEEMKRKRKSGDRRRENRIHFFAIDGEDFSHETRCMVALHNPVSNQHVPVRVRDMLDWHLSFVDNFHQSDCKLFQRIALGLSKTYPSVILKPSQILYLKDKEPLMNDGCALMSKSLAKAIWSHFKRQDHLPSCFQGRIAGAKGLWMVDADHSYVNLPEGSLWIQISDSQLKIKPHPVEWQARHSDKEKLRFEVVAWSSALRPVDLNVQLLNILDHGGLNRRYLATITEKGIDETYKDFEEMVETDNALLARHVIDKVQPRSDEVWSRKPSRPANPWILDNGDSARRYCEAGFSPREFEPLRECLRKLLSASLARSVDDLHIRIPLSTYAFCIADPYDVLAEDEVHFIFSRQWDDADFQGIFLNDRDVLIGRTPAHRACDVQRRRAVFKEELSHFTDVIVFSTRGNTPLASLLSGGDYDGDKPWICWDPQIVQPFRNSSPPEKEHSAEYFGLIDHSRKMSVVQVPDEFLERTFRFNLLPSFLGICTTEHERIIYDEEGGVDCSRGKELAMLLSHLVDAVKSGYQLPQARWHSYKAELSPKARSVPAYKGQRQTVGLRWNPQNIIDYLKFEVADAAKERALTSFEKLVSSIPRPSIRDSDLVRRWIQAEQRSRQEKERSDETLHLALQDIKSRIEKTYSEWSKNIRERQLNFREMVQAALNLVEQIQPPKVEHEISVMWQNSAYEWESVRASCIYSMYPSGKFPLYAVGETLCRLKAEAQPSRSICDPIYNSFKVNKKKVRHLGLPFLLELDDDPLAGGTLRADDEEEYEGESVFDAFELVDYDNDVIL